MSNNEQPLHADDGQPALPQPYAYLHEMGLSTAWPPKHAEYLGNVNMLSVEPKAEIAVISGLVLAYTLEARCMAEVHGQLTQFSYVLLIEAMKAVRDNQDKTAYWHNQDTELAQIFGIALEQDNEL